MCESYGPKQTCDAEMVWTVHRHHDAGGDSLVTAGMCRVSPNELLVGEPVRDRHIRAVSATGFGNVLGPKGEFLGVRGNRRAPGKQLHPVRRVRRRVTEWSGLAGRWTMLGNVVRRWPPRWK